MEAEKTEALEAEIDRIIEKRAAERKGANSVEELWAESVRVRHEKRRRENRAAWYDFHEYMRGLHARLAEEHEAKALALANRAEGSQLDFSHYAA